jgi:hypothetical protein
MKVNVSMSYLKLHSSNSTKLQTKYRFSKQTLTLIQEKAFSKKQINCITLSLSASSARK